MNEKKLLVVLVLVTVGILGGMLFLSSKMQTSAEITVSSEAKVMATEEFHDWGQIEMDAGNVEAKFQIQNVGTDPLKLFNVVTSCSCTNAFLTLGDTRTPLFGMHTQSNYVLEVAPNETAELTVIFDPAFHGPSGVGPINRQVMIETNDLDNPQLTFEMVGEVYR